MKILKILLLAGFALAVNVSSAQTARLLGSWQLVRQSTCLDEASNDAAPGDVDALRAEMRSRSGASAQVVSFKANSTGQESTRILNSRGSANQKKFHYKFNGNLLLILDKRSQTISDSYTIDKITGDSLIMSSSTRPCEVRIFTKIKD